MVRSDLIMWPVRICVEKICVKPGPPAVFYRRTIEATEFSKKKRFVGMVVAPPFAVYCSAEHVLYMDKYAQVPIVSLTKQRIVRNWAGQILPVRSAAKFVREIHLATVNLFRFLRFDCKILHISSIYAAYATAQLNSYGRTTRLRRVANNFSCVRCNQTRFIQDEKFCCRPITRVMDLRRIW